jgi:hypothetical protein
MEEDPWMEASSKREKSRGQVQCRINLNPRQRLRLCASQEKTHVLSDQDNALRNHCLTQHQMSHLQWNLFNVMNVTLWWILEKSALIHQPKVPGREGGYSSLMTRLRGRFQPTRQEDQGQWGGMEALMPWNVHTKEKHEEGGELRKALLLALVLLAAEVDRLPVRRTETLGTEFTRLRVVLHIHPWGPLTEEENPGSKTLSCFSHRATIFLHLPSSFLFVPST